MTDAELLLWRHLRNGQIRGLKFRRQFPIGSYVVDFVCWDRRLVIEVDGGQHADNQEDRIRREEIEALGFRVLRFWNNEGLSHSGGVLSVIDRELSLRSTRS
jgi:very-short-patch-repair endonuclease